MRRMVFGKSNAIYWCGMLFLLGVIFSYALFVPRTSARTALLFVLVFALSIMVMLLATAQDNKQMRRILAYFQQECRPDKAIPELQQLLLRGMADNRRQWVRVNYSAALIISGFWSQGRQVLQSITFPPGAQGLQYRFIVQANLFECCYGEGDVQGASDCLANMRQWLESNLDKKNKGAWNSILENYGAITMSKEYTLRMMQGDFAGAKEYYEAALPLSSTREEAMDRQYHLACAYRQQGMEQAARAAFEAVATQGGTTWYAAAARDALLQQ